MIALLGIPCAGSRSSASSALPIPDRTVSLRLKGDPNEEDPVTARPEIRNLPVQTREPGFRQDEKMEG